MYKLILIDDETFILSQLKTLIKWDELGFLVVEIFGSAITALEYIKNNKVDAVITDIKMPEIDGLHFAKFCRENYPNMQVALMSAYRDFEYAQSAIKYNVVGYVIKPIIRDELISIVKIMNDNLNRKSTNSTFTDSQFQAKCQKIFSDLFCGITTNIDDLKNQLNLINIRLDPLCTPCTLINIHIKDFDTYIENVWKYEKFRLYNAISLSVPFDRPNYYSILVRYAQSNVEILIVHKSVSNKKETIDSFIKEVSDILENILNISSTITIAEQINAISDIIELKNIQAPISQELIYNDTINKAVAYIKLKYATISSVDDVAKYVNLSPVYFGSFFKHHIKESFTNYLNGIRIEKAKELLQDKDVKAFSISEMVGYKSIPYFYKTFKSITNLTPAQYKIKYMEGKIK